MGACLGRCRLQRSKGLRNCTDDQEAELVPDDEKDNRLIYKIIKFKQKKRPQFIDKFWERQDLNYSRLNQNNRVESSDIQLQSLDAQTLIASATAHETTTSHQLIAASSRNSSSLDLEWEHEYGNDNRAMSQSWLFLSQANSVQEDSDDNRAATCANVPTLQPLKTRASSRTSWSHISTPESLEWDVDEEQRDRLRLEDDNLDHETLELLHQIEMLKNRVLHETGNGMAFCEEGSSPGRS